MKLLHWFLIFSIVFIAACSLISLQPAKFGWPVESVLEINDAGGVMDDRYSISFDARRLFFEEFGDSLNYGSGQLRLIRNEDGYYFITASRFKNVYVFSGLDGAMNLQKQILISENGMDNPAFNQRPPYVELLTGTKNYLLSHLGIEGGN